MQQNDGLAVGWAALFIDDVQDGGAQRKRHGALKHSPLNVPVTASQISRRDGLYCVLVFPGLGGSHSGLVRPPAKRVGVVKASRGFESLPLRHSLKDRTSPPRPPSPPEERGELCSGSLAQDLV